MIQYYLIFIVFTFFGCNTTNISAMWNTPSSSDSWSDSDSCEELYDNPWDDKDSCEDMSSMKSICHSLEKNEASKNIRIANPDELLIQDTREKLKSLCNVITLMSKNHDSFLAGLASDQAITQDLYNEIADCIVNVLRLKKNSVILDSDLIQTAQTFIGILEPLLETYPVLSCSDRYVLFSQIKIAPKIVAETVKAFLSLYCMVQGKHAIFINTHHIKFPEWQEERIDGGHFPCQGVVEKKDPKGNLKRSYFTNITTDDYGHDLGYWNCSLVPANSGEKKQFFKISTLFSQQEACNLWDFVTSLNFEAWSEQGVSNYYSSTTLFKNPLYLKATKDLDLGCFYIATSFPRCILNNVQLFYDHTTNKLTCYFQDGTIIHSTDLSNISSGQITHIDDDCFYAEDGMYDQHKQPCSAQSSINPELLRDLKNDILKGYYLRLRDTETGTIDTNRCLVAVKRNIYAYVDISEDFLNR